MPELITRLAGIVRSRLKAVGCETPSVGALVALLEAAYHATLRTEEGRFLRGSITFANPRQRNGGPPIKVLSSPEMWSLGRQSPLTVERLVKLSRAIDMWAGSIAVHGRTANDLYVWGVVDQLLHRNVDVHHEDARALENPGAFEVVMDGVGDITVFHRRVLLGGIRGHELVERESDAIRSVTIKTRIAPYLLQPARAIGKVLQQGNQIDLIHENLVDEWTSTVARLCIGLRRIGSGGSILMTPNPRLAHLTVGQPFCYTRLGDASVLRVLDKRYDDLLRDHNILADQVGQLQGETVWLWQMARSDAEDRASELTGAVKIVTSLAAIDGLLLLSPLLHVRGFGVKIGDGESAKTVYDGADFIRRGRKARQVDTSRYGTRHNSMLRYCRADKDAIGVIVSQDGNVRIVMTVNRSLILWNNVKLLNYLDFGSPEAKADTAAKRHSTDLARKLFRMSRPRIGYTATPKTLDALLRVLED
jgi:hypothetical protein